MIPILTLPVTLICIFISALHMDMHILPAARAWPIVTECFNLRLDPGMVALGDYCLGVIGDGHSSLRSNFMATLPLLFWLLVPILVLVALIDLATASTDRKARILRRDGLSQQAIASRLGISRYRVRLALA
jgi:hypothetical protein